MKYVVGELSQLRDAAVAGAREEVGVRFDASVYPPGPIQLKHVAETLQPEAAADGSI